MSGSLVVLTAGVALAFDFSAGGDGDDAAVTVSREEIQQRGGSGSASASSNRNVEWDTALACSDSLARHDQYRACPEGQTPFRAYCDDGSEATPPLWVRYETPAGSGNWSGWELLRWYHCGAETTIEFAVRQAWDRMPIDAHQVTIEPPNGWVYASLPTIVFVDDQPRTMTTELLGRSVILRANPANMTWDWGNGETTITQDPGRPYPDHTVFHTYLHQDGEVAITLTTSWTGQYSLDGGASWEDAPGMAYTTSAPIPLTIHNPKGHLVDCDLAGNCTSDSWRG